MKLKILGSQSPYNTPGHNCPGYLLQEGNNRLLLDSGSGSHSLLSYPNDLENLSVILSHLHRDHYNDVYNLQYSSFVFHNQKRIQKPIDIILPATPSTIHDDILSEDNAFATYKTINSSSNMQIGSMNVSFCPTDHPVETYGVKVKCGNRTIVYTSDTSYSAKSRLVDFSKGADILICEASLLKEHGFPEINSHLTAYQAATIAKEAGVKGLILTHFWPEEPVEKYVCEAKEVFPNVIPAMEGLTIDIPVVHKERNLERDF